MTEGFRIQHTGSPLCGLHTVKIWKQWRIQLRRYSLPKFWTKSGFGRPPCLPPLVAHLVDKVGTKAPPPPPPPHPWWHIWWTKLELRTPLVAHLVDKVGTKDPPPGWHIWWTKLELRTPPPPPSPPPPPLGRFRAGGKQSRFELPSCLLWF